MSKEFGTRFSFRKKIWFILGPSGVGKSTFSIYLSHQLDWHHLETDNPVAHDDWKDNYGLKEKWVSYLKNDDGRLLVEKLTKLFVEADKAGVIVSLPSYPLSLKHIRVVKDNIRIVYLYGNEENCLRSFRDRESKKPRGLDDSHLHGCNDPLFNPTWQADLLPYRIDMFNEYGVRRKKEEVFAELLARIHKEEVFVKF
jgi:adenylate kinase family enzyme